MAVAGLHLAQEVNLERCRKLQEESNFGAEIRLLIRLPDGSERKAAARMGYTVQHVKALLHKEFGLPLIMELESTDGQRLLDPLSLSDCRNIRSGTTNVLIVKVD